MSVDLPVNWTLAPLANLGDMVGGGTPSKNNPSFWMDGTIPWVSPKEFRAHLISDAEEHITQEAVAASATNIVPESTVLVVTRSGILSNSLPVAITTNPVAINQDVKGLIPFEGISAEYIAAALRRYSHQILSECSKSGTTVPSIVTHRLQAFQIPVAPSAEQVRIVTCIDAILSRLGIATEAVGAVPALIAKYRAAILGIVFRGDATQCWRDNEEIEDAEANVQALTAARAEGGKTIAAPSPDLASAYNIGPDVPWPFVTLESVCDPNRSITYGVIQTGDETEGGVPTVRAGDIKNFTIDLSGLKRVRREVVDRHPRTLLRGGEVLVSIRGTTGNVAVAGPEMVGMNVSREVAVIPVLKEIEPKYVAYALASPAGQSVIMRQVKGVAQSGINLIDLRAFPLPLLGLSEQHQVVQFVDRALDRLAAIGDRAEEIGQSLEALSATVLQKAFRGELTPQNPDDEPASALVQRSMAARAAAKPKKRSRKSDQTQGDLFRSKNVPQTRKDVGANHLQKIVAQASAGSLPVKELYHRAAMDVDEFYKQLATEVMLGHIRQTPDKTRLEVANAA